MKNFVSIPHEKTRRFITYTFLSFVVLSMALIFSGSTHIVNAMFENDFPFWNTNLQNNDTRENIASVGNTNSQDSSIEEDFPFWNTNLQNNNIEEENSNDTPVLTEQPEEDQETLNEPSVPNVDEIFLKDLNLIDFADYLYENHIYYCHNLTKAIARNRSSDLLIQDDYQSALDYYIIKKNQFFNNPQNRNVQNFETLHQEALEYFHNESAKEGAIPLDSQLPDIPYDPNEDDSEYESCFDADGFLRPLVVMKPYPPPPPGLF